VDGMRRVIATFPDYAQAQHAVDKLSDRRFAVDRLAIVGTGLQSYEQITGRKGYGRAALGGLLNGALVGALAGWLLGLFSLVQPLVSAAILALWGIVIGGMIGLVIGLGGHALNRGRRDFSSVSAMRAEHYEVHAAEEVADEAERILAEVGPIPVPANRR
jgi:hypothetical protein